MYMGSLSFLFSVAAALQAGQNFGFINSVDKVNLPT